MILDYTCRLCQGKGTIELQPDEEYTLLHLEQADRDRLENMIPGLCHERCWNVWFIASKLERRLAELVYVLQADTTGELRQTIAQRISNVTRNWIQNELKRFQILDNGRYWTEDFPGMIMDAPDKLHELLRKTRDMLAGIARDRRAKIEQAQSRFAQ